MSDYTFYIALLRFVARKTEAVDDNVREMLTVLNHLADDLEPGGEAVIAGDQLAVAARGLAGTAAFLQKQILPEAIAHGNAEGEAQLRWAIDTSMATMTMLMTQQSQFPGEAVTLRLPAPPGIKH